MPRVRVPMCHDANDGPEPDQHSVQNRTQKIGQDRVPIIHDWHVVEGAHMSTRRVHFLCTFCQCAFFSLSSHSMDNCVIHACNRAAVECRDMGHHACETDALPCGPLLQGALLLGAQEGCFWQSLPASRKRGGYAAH